MSGTVAAIVAAAGESRRMGACKQLLDLGGKTVIARCIESILQGGISRVVVVVGPGGERVKAEAGRYPVEVVVNRAPGGDMASSVLAGRRELEPAVSGVVVALCDYPLIAPATIGYLAAVHRSAPTAILIPRHRGRKGHPTLFPNELLAGLEQGGTLRDILHRSAERVSLLDTEDGGILHDMDTPEEYRRMLRVIRSGAKAI